MLSAPASACGHLRPKLSAHGNDFTTPFCHAGRGVGECEQELWTALRANDMDAVQALVAKGCSHERPNTPQLNTKITDGSRRAAKGGHAMGHCKQRPDRECASAVDCALPSGVEVGPCTLPGRGVCTGDATQTCAIDAHCGTTAPCVVATGVCEGEPSVTCSLNSDCAGKGPCLFDGVCERTGEACSPRSRCAEGDRCVRGRRCASDAGKACAADAHCAGKGPCSPIDLSGGTATAGTAPATGSSQASRLASSGSSGRSSSFGDQASAAGSTNDATSPLAAANNAVPSEGDASDSSPADGQGSHASFPPESIPGAFPDNDPHGEECCDCPEGPDDRWPDVLGSPDLNAMGGTEYEWGAAGRSESANPIQRKNQPKGGGCCPCSGGRCAKDTSKGCSSDDDCPEGPCLDPSSGSCTRDPQRSCTKDEDCAPRLGKCRPRDAGTCLYDRDLVCVSDEECKVPAPRGEGALGGTTMKGPCMGVPAGDEEEGPKGDPYANGICYLDASVPCDSSSPCPAETAPCMPATFGRCRRATTTKLRCTTDAQCGAQGPCNTRGGRCKGDALIRCFSSGECGTKGPCVEIPGVCSRAAWRKCVYDEECGKAGPCVATARGRCAKDAARRCRRDESCDPCLHMVRKCEQSPVCNPALLPKCEQRRGPCLLQPTRGVCARRAGKGCSLDRDCGPHGPCMDPGPERNRSATTGDQEGGRRSPYRVCLQAPLRECTTDESCDQTGPCVADTIGSCMRDVDAACAVDNDCGQTGPCTFARPYDDFEAALQAAIQAERRVMALSRQQGSGAEGTRRAERQAQLAEARAVRARSAREQLMHREPGIETPAEVACRLLGKEKCRELVFHAVDRKRIDLLAGWRILVAGPATEACLGIGAEKCGMTLSTATAQGRADVVETVRELQQTARESNASFAKGEDQDAIAALKDAERVARLGDNATTAQAEREALEAAENYNKQRFRWKPSFGQCYAPGHETSECFCRALGTAKCGEGLFRAYLRHHTDVLASVRDLLRQNATTPAVTMCDALGPQRCAETFMDAVRRRDVDVLQAWKFLVDGSLPSGNPMVRTLKRALRTALKNMREAERSNTARETDGQDHGSLEAAVPPKRLRHAGRRNASRAAGPVEGPSTSEPLQFPENCREAGFMCAPQVALSGDRGACLAPGNCTGDAACESLDGGSSTRQRCEATVTNTDGSPCVWKTENQWVEGCGEVALFLAIHRQDMVAVQALVGAGLDLNTRLGDICGDPNANSTLKRIAARNRRIQLGPDLNAADASKAPTRTSHSPAEAAGHSDGPSALEKKLHAMTKRTESVTESGNALLGRVSGQQRKAESSTCQFDLFSEGFSSFTAWRRTLGWSPSAPPKPPKWQWSSSIAQVQATSEMRPLDVAQQVDFGGAARLLRWAGGRLATEQEVKVHPYKWNTVVDSTDRSPGDFRRLLLPGIHGHLQYFPWWQCQDTPKQEMDAEPQTNCFPQQADLQDVQCDEVTGEVRSHTRPCLAQGEPDSESDDLPFATTDVRVRRGGATEQRHGMYSDATSRRTEPNGAQAQDWEGALGCGCGENGGSGTRCEREGG